MEIKAYQHLEVWRRGMNLAQCVYSLTNSFPKSELFGMTSQLRRAAVSVPSNIAEGNSRGSRKDYASFVSIARGSLAETETLLQLALNLELGSRDTLIALLEEAGVIGRMLNALRRRLQED